MRRLRVSSGGALRGRVRVPGDKSISHRALLLGALAEGDSQVRGFLPSGDCLATLACVRALGVEVVAHDVNTLTVRGMGGLAAPTAALNCARSGTTMRLLAGILAGQSGGAGAVTLTGEPQLLRRPMGRIVEPLRQMGADIADDDGRAPLVVRGRRLRGCDFVLAVASAQVKSALLLAGCMPVDPLSCASPAPPATTRSGCCPRWGLASRWMG